MNWEKLEQKGTEDDPVSSDHQVNRARKVIPDHRDPLVSMDHKVCVATKDQWVYQVKLVSEECKDLQDVKVTEVSQVVLEQQEGLVQRDYQVYLDLLVDLVKSQVSLMLSLTSSDS